MISKQLNLNCNIFVILENFCNNFPKNNFVPSKLYFLDPTMCIKYFCNNFPIIFLFPVSSISYIPKSVRTIFLYSNWLCNNFFFLFPKILHYIFFSIPIDCVTTIFFFFLLHRPVHLPFEINEKQRKTMKINENQWK